MAEILVVDDEVPVRDMLRDMLGTAGHEVTMAADGNTALELQSRSSFDLAITDILMPGLNGLDTIQGLKAHDPELKIVALSGGGSFHRFDLLNQALAVGASVTMTKPVDMEELLMTVDNLLRGGA